MQALLRENLRIAEDRGRASSGRAEAWLADTDCLQREYQPLPLDRVDEMHADYCLITALAQSYGFVDMVISTAHLHHFASIVVVMIFFQIGVVVGHEQRVRHPNLGGLL